jgi:hypothetical protein
VRPSIEARQADHKVASGKVTKAHHLKQTVIKTRGGGNVHPAAEPAAVGNGHRRGWSALRRSEIHAELRLIWRVVQTGTHGGESECNNTCAALQLRVLLQCMRNLRANSIRCNVQEEPIYATSKVHYANIHATRRSATRKHTRSLHWIA